MNFLQGTLDLVVLRALAAGPLHGYDVVDWIRRTTREAICIEDGALYASLHRMEGRGWLSHVWQVSPKGRRAKYYQLTAAGVKALRSGERDWSRFTEALTRVFAAQGA